MLGRNWRWLSPVATRYVERFGGQTRPSMRSVRAFLHDDETFQRAWLERRAQLRIATWMTGSGEMLLVGAAARWPVPSITSIGELAQRLGVSVTDLEWFSDLKGIGSRSRSSKLQHYHYRVLAKTSGSVRLIEAPKRHLKAIQRQILAEILERVPIHPCVHGFVKGRSIKTFAAMHVGKRVVLRMDLREFFPSIGRARVQALFRTMGYPEAVANFLGGICTSQTPRSVWRMAVPDALRDVNRTTTFEASQFYARPHLPQGAPTSPALANLCGFRLDSRLNGLARSAGATYTRYADDLAFSGDVGFERRVERFATHVAAIAEEEGWAVNHRKTRIMRQAVRQHLTGLVTNERVNVVRANYDRLKAILTNCIRHGAEGQNRDNHPSFRMHLEGRVGFVESINPGKGKRLRTLLGQIQW